MNVDEWQTRLEQTFGSKGLVGRRILDIIEKEKEYGLYVTNKFIGYRVISDSFMDFFIQTLKLAYDWTQKFGFPDSYPDYSLIFLFQLTNFKSLRAAENLLLCGYPLDGYALLCIFRLIPATHSA
jgi:hypothetical protein